MKLSPAQTEIHNQAVYLAKRHASLESKLVETLRGVERLQIHKKFGMSLFDYATSVLKLSESLSYALITIARKTAENPELLMAIQDKTLSVSKASRIVSSLDKSNSKELVEFAKNHTRSEIDREIARRNPKAAKPDKARPINDDEIEMTITVSRSTYEKFKRAESLEAQKQKSMKGGDVLDAIAEAYLIKYDPVRKAERSVKRKLWQARVVSGQHVEPEFLPRDPSASPQDDGLCGTQGDGFCRPQDDGSCGAQDDEFYRALDDDGPRAAQQDHIKRTPLTAEQKHAVFLRDKGRCTHKDIKNHVCGSDKWTEIHHIVRIADGGTNDLENLTTLCSFHHDLVHQMSLPIEGQVSWLRSPVVKYG